MTSKGGGAASAAIYFVCLIVAWCGAWLAYRVLQSHISNFNMMSTDAVAFVYWTALKLAIWVVPAVVLIKSSGTSFAASIGFDGTPRMLAWGLAAGFALAAINIAAKGALATPSPSWGLLNAALVAPVVEEIAFRGAILPALKQRFRFAVANTATAAMFTAAHMPGWWFQDRLTEMLVIPVGGALSIFVLGWIFGWIAHASRTVGAAAIAHALNNLTA